MSPTVADDSLLPIAAPAPSVKPTAVGRLISISAPPSLAVSLLAVFVRLVAALVATGLFLYWLGWFRSYFGESLARAMGTAERGATMSVLFGAIVPIASAILSYAVFRIGSRRWVKVAL